MALLGGGHAIGVLQVRHVRQRFSQFEGLVVGLALAGSISTADHRHANAALVEPAGDPADQGGLARAAEGQVADAQHGHAQAVDGGAPRSYRRLRQRMAVV